MKIFWLSFLITTVVISIGISIAQLVTLIESYFKPDWPPVFIQAAGFVLIGGIIMHKVIDYFIDLLKL